MLVIALTTFGYPPLIRHSGRLLAPIVAAATLTDLCMLQVMHVQVIAHTINIDIDRQFFFIFQAIDVTGDAAAVKLIDDYFDLRFTDYLSLLLIGQRWVIVNKVYFLHP